jgi:hypothetical protein
MSGDVLERSRHRRHLPLGKQIDLQINAEE